MPSEGAAAGNEESMQRLFAEAFDNSNGDASGLLKLLGSAPLSEEQQAAIQMLVSLAAYEEPEDAAGEGGGDGRTPAGDVPYMERDPNRMSAAELRAMWRELESLREVNDTVAAALGACRVCWGGTPDCNNCGGFGDPGWLAPHVELFDALVDPAIRRARSSSRTRAYRETAARGWP